MPATTMTAAPKIIAHRDPGCCMKDAGPVASAGPILITLLAGGTAALSADPEPALV
jgi:hypothetical protein